MGRINVGTVGLLTGFLLIAVVASPALGDRPQAPNAGGGLTNASSNVAAINSTLAYLLLLRARSKSTWVLPHEKGVSFTLSCLQN
ncbi:hypothetical protein EJB05_01574 [Eragrostis curvula]|uniref:Uncharacterized protein n=1 Tax=Eragrostis curvula TaxID=38414 RepID=A0A5J9WS68_9POAL|nr:hypothetical protein EJB05_01574 [Eragrostis curvula]